MQYFWCSLSRCVVPHVVCATFRRQRHMQMHFLAPAERRQNVLTTLSSLSSAQRHPKMGTGGCGRMLGCWDGVEVALRQLQFAKLHALNQSKQRQWWWLRASCQPVLICIPQGDRKERRRHLWGRLYVSGWESASRKWKVGGWLTERYMHDCLQLGWKMKTPLTRSLCHWLILLNFIESLPSQSKKDTLHTHTHNHKS